MYNTLYRLTPYLFTAFLCLFILVAVTGMPPASSSPLGYYGSDGKEVLRKTTDLLFNDFASLMRAPFEYQDPRTDSSLYTTLKVLVSNPQDNLMRLISWIRNDPVFVTNIYFILTFPLAALSFVFAARMLNISFAAAIPAGILFSFLPYHFMRGILHLANASYFMIPLLGLILIWTWSARPLFFNPGRKVLGRIQLGKKELLAVICVLVLQPMNHHYLFYFTMLILMAGLCGAVYRRSFYHVLSIAVIVVFSAMAISKSGIPDYAYSKLYPEQIAELRQNSAAVSAHQPISGYGQADYYGLRLTQMLLPVDNHRFEPLNRIKQDFNKHHSQPSSTEAAFSTLGLMAGLSFLGLMLFWFIPPSNRWSLWRKLSALCLFAFLLGTVGGLASMLTAAAHTAWPDSVLVQIRTVNRISIFIAFFCLLALAWALNRLFLKIKTAGLNPFIRTTLYTGIACAILLTGLYDQLYKGLDYGRSHHIAAKMYKNDADFIEKIKSLTAPDARIFQLPALYHHQGYPYPLMDREKSHALYLSGLPLPRFYYTDHYTGYIHSRTLRWSFGADRGSRQMDWYFSAASLSSDHLVMFLLQSAFSGIIIDTYAYREVEAAHQLAMNLASAAGTDILSDELSRYLFVLLDPGKHTPGLELPFQKKLIHQGHMRIFSGKSSGMATQFSKVENTLVSDGKPGFLIYGPYISLEPGEYVVEFLGRLVSQDGSEARIRMDVTADSGQAVIVEHNVMPDQEFSEGNTLANMRFSTNKKQEHVEFRMFVPEGIILELDYVTVLQKSLHLEALP